MFDEIKNEIMNDPKKKIVFISMVVLIVFFVICLCIRITSKPIEMSKKDEDKYIKEIKKIKTENSVLQEKDDKLSKDDIYASVEQDVEKWIEAVAGLDKKSAAYNEAIKEVYTSEALNSIKTTDIYAKSDEKADLTASINDLKVYYDVTDKPDVVNVMAEYDLSPNGDDEESGIKKGLYRLKGEFVYNKEKKKWQMNTVIKNNQYLETFDLMAALE